jgi:hypothetical protein
MKSKDGKQAWCKSCACSNRIQAHRDNPGKTRAAERKRRLVIREWLYNYLASHACVDCGENDPIVLQFDHIRDKTYNISNMSRSYGLESIKEEIDKCEVRCANCHLRRTAKQQNWYKSINKGT